MEFVNHTPFVAKIYRAQLHYRDLMIATVIAKASFEIAGGTVLPVADQLAISDSDTDTPLGPLPSDIVPIKFGCDFAVYGGAMSGGRKVESLDVVVRAGQKERALRISGDRKWMLIGDGLHASAAIPFDLMPLDYSRAFGGKANDPSGMDIAYPDNPLGTGYVVASKLGEGKALPNIEEVDQPVTSWQAQVLPGGLLPLPRTSALRGTRGLDVDLEAQKTSIRPIHFCWSHPRMLLDEYPAGQIVNIRGMTTSGEWQFRLPHFDLAAKVTLGEREHTLRLVPDTLGVVPSHGRFWIVARRAFAYQILPERIRRVCVEASESRIADSKVTSIAAELASLHPSVAVLPPDEPERMPVPWEMLRELYPLTQIVESLPLCASG